MDVLAHLFETVREQMMYYKDSESAEMHPDIEVESLFIGCGQLHVNSQIKDPCSTPSASLCPLLAQTWFLCNILKLD